MPNKGIVKTSPKTALSKHGHHAVTLTAPLSFLTQNAPVHHRLNMHYGQIPNFGERSINTCDRYHKSDII